MTDNTNYILNPEEKQLLLQELSSDAMQQLNTQMMGAVKRSDVVDLLANNKAVPVHLLKEYIGDISYMRLEALKLATETALKINHFEHAYKDIDSMLEDIDIVHMIAERNFKYLMGEK